MLRVRDMVHGYPVPRRPPWAAPRRRIVLDGVSLTVEAGQALGLVGESGSGKTTLARLVLGLDAPQGGSVQVAGTEPRHAARAGKVGAVFQDPYASLDPRMTVGASVAEPLLGRVAAAERRRLVAEMLEAVGLPEAAHRTPHEFSGGQRQRIALARALVGRPALVVADEPVSSLDVSIQAQVLALIAALRRRHGAAWLFISHDLAVVRHVTDRVAVLHQGRIVETGSTADVFAAPQHPYTRALLAAMPRLTPPPSAAAAASARS